ncbi:MAG TPA: dipeptide epimerase [Chthoniobacterales bacterium]|jgi:L-alanine-DL-glutamate epimerase-like enolase superfamily enzyme
MKSTVEIIQLQPRHVFRISRGAKALVRNVVLRVESQGVVGLGEASPNAFYKETADDVAARLVALAPWLEGIAVAEPEEIVALWPEIWRRVQPSRAAACAVDLALWDWLSAAREVALSELLWGDAARPVTSCVTLGLSEPAELEAKLEELAGFPLIKIKLGRENPVELVSIIRERTSARLVVDANAAWDAAFLAKIAPQLDGLGVEFIEQPLPPGEGFAAPEVPVFADESCVIPEDIDRMHDGFAGFNIKLVKCGGITPALEMLRRAQHRGLRPMVGCMLESSVLIAAGLAIAQRTDYADLDGSWLLQSEPFGRVRFENGVLTLS